MAILKTVLTRAAVGVAAVTLTGAVADVAAAVAFVGRDVPSTAVISPGVGGPVPFTYQNTGGDGLFPPAGSTFTFTAPGGTRFETPQTSVPGQYSADGVNYISNNLALRNCALSNGNRTMTCEGFGINGGQSSWPAGSYFRYAPVVRVDANAPSGTALPAGTATVAYNDVRAGALTISDGTLNVATPAAQPRRAGLCLDVFARTNGTPVRVWQCLNHTNQRFVVEGGQIKLADTVGTGNEQCVSTSANRASGSGIVILRCAALGTPGHQNQNWVIRGGQLVLRDTIGSPREMCLDVTTPRVNNTNTILYPCQANNPNQYFVIERGYFKVEDTL